MTKLEALKELAAKVEAGTFWNFGYWGALDAQMFDLSGNAFSGSLDAAKALHEAVLPGWKPVIDLICGEIGMHIEFLDDDGKPTDEWMWQFEVRFTDNPARAWLLAILRALIAMEESQ